MWKTIYYRKQAQVCLALAHLTREEDKAAKNVVAASRYLEQADRLLRENTLQPAE